MKWSVKERIQHLGRQAGIDMTTDDLNNFEQKLKYVAKIQEFGGQASVEMELRTLRDMASALKNTFQGSSSQFP